MHFVHRKIFSLHWCFAFVLTLVGLTVTGVAGSDVIARGMGMLARHGTSIYTLQFSGNLLTSSSRQGDHYRDRYS